MDIAQISTVNGAITEGTAMRVLGLSRGLSNMGHSVTVVCESGCENVSGDFRKVDARLMKAMIWLYGPESPLDAPLMRFPLVSLLARRILDSLPQIGLDAVSSCHILHCHQHWAASVVEKRRKTGQKILFDYHGMIVPTDADGASIDSIDSGSQSRILKWQKAVFDEADGISFVTGMLRDKMVDLYDVDVDKTYVVPDGVDFVHVAKGWNKGAVLRLRQYWQADSATVVMYVGSLDPMHGGSYLREVVHGLLEDANTDKNLRFVVVGVGSMAEDFACLQRRYKGRLVYVPGIPYSVLPSYLAAADILLVPHPRNLTMDNIESGKLLTYLASGKPTVVTALAYASRFLDDGLNSILCDPESPSTMVDGIRRLVNSPELQVEIGAQGAALVEDERDWSSVALIATQVYQHLLAR